MDKGHLDQLHDPSGPVWIGPLIGMHLSDEVTPNDFGNCLRPSTTCHRGIRLGCISGQRVATRLAPLKLNALEKRSPVAGRSVQPGNW